MTIVKTIFVSGGCQHKIQKQSRGCWLPLRATANNFLRCFASRQLAAEPLRRMIIDLFRAFAFTQADRLNGEVPLL